MLSLTKGLSLALRVFILHDAATEDFLVFLDDFGLHECKFFPFAELERPIDQAWECVIEFFALYP